MSLKQILSAFVVLLILSAIYFLEKEKITPAAQGDSKIVEIKRSIEPKTKDRTNILTKKSAEYPLARELVSPNDFLNSEPFTLAEKIGQKVILVDFWTYSCINCQRTIPYLNSWQEKYADKGLLIVGVHTPEFEFEKKIENVLSAIEKFNIKYPVVLDNQYLTWRNYRNQYWPRKYLIDIDGFIVYDHIGEGAYEETEEKIQKLLKERAEVLAEKINFEEDGSKKSSIISLFKMADQVISPETYFGASRNELLGNGESGKEGKFDFVFPKEIIDDKLYLNGLWQIKEEYAETTPNSSLRYQFKAKEIYLVAEADREGELEIYLNSQIISNDFRGEDVDEQGRVKIKESRLYKILKSQNLKDGLLEIKSKKPGIRLFTFTFG